MNWREPGIYEYTHALNADQWAWEFLRRNNDYRSDYQWFIQTWQTLEQRYGKPPRRNYSRWQQDPLAWRISSSQQTDQDCTMDGERLQIECWMGQKWGFYKFPNDPSLCAPITADQLAWRETHTEAALITDENKTSYLTDHSRVALGFDLSMPLKQQWDDSRKILAILQRQLLKNSPDKICRIATQRASWNTCLRILDGVFSENYDIVNEHFITEGIDITLLSQKAFKLCQSDYRLILTIPE